jgi:hypothetical protein
MSEKVFDAVATVGEYTDRNGQTKKRYLNVGSVFKNNKGLFLKLDALPLSRDWSGFISFYEPKPRDEAAPAGRSPRDMPERMSPSELKPHDFDDPIPF